MTATTGYGSWCNRVSQYSTSPEADIRDFINGGDNAWQIMLEESGALEEIQDAYRRAIDAVLPPSVSLCGNDFLGPADPADDEWAGYPTDETGALAFEELITDIDLGEIVDRYDPYTLEQIGRELLGSKAKNPAKSASGVVSKLGLKPFTYYRDPDSKRPQALYYAGVVREALAKRPGQGARTDRAEEL
ncbi:hypothetical protein [Streptomyces sp. NPDC056670]|uniref:hypothetical protein n=1 Tax=Streptomyces sp. NPDC056670 TaxID=3345904 RepID=UPI0036D01BD9